MAKSLGGFRAALPAGWIALSVAGIAYARIKGIPGWAAFPALAAFLVEYPFYLVPAFPALRERAAGARLPFYLVASALLPYLAACAAIPFRWIAVAQLAALALAMGLWFYALPRGWITDLAFLAFVAWVLLGRYVDAIYPAPYPKVDLAILGKLAVFQMAVMVLIVGRRVPETGYGFIPTAREWRIGAVNFVYFVIVGLPVALAIGAARFDKPAPVWAIVGTFIGILWVTALGEEFLLRGVLQPWIEDWTGSTTAGLLVASVVFGSVHLWFRHFPNWRWLIVAGILGWFCGRARNQSGGIRAAMVTHALVVAAYRGFFA